MRTAILLLALLLALGAGLFEAAWRADHAPGDPEAGSRSGARVAEIRYLPEGSVLPYGKGVFLRSRYAPLLSLQARLVFAGRCGAMATRWLAEDRLRIHCELIEGEPVLPREEVDGVRIEVVVQRRRAVAALPQDAAAVRW